VGKTAFRRAKTDQVGFIASEANYKETAEDLVSDDEERKL
jgi:hypothetical protein